MARRAVGQGEAMDDEQQERFARAVDRKKDEARTASQAAPGPGDHGGKASGPEQPELDEPGRPQDVRSTRDTSTRHGKVTADKWNQ
jgi:hypothetical protein